MIFLLALLATTAQAAETGSLECKAIYRQTDAAGRTTEKNTALAIVGGQNGVFKYEAELEGRAFSLIEEKNSTYLAQITVGPDYTKGIVSRGVADAEGRFTLSDVDGYTLYRMECRKLPEVGAPHLSL